jgi:hypothetical protein
MSTGYALSNGTDLTNVFMSLNNGASLFEPNIFTSNTTFKGNIDLSASFLYYNMPSTTQTAPFSVGYTTDMSNANVSVPNNTAINRTIAIYPGVWLVTTSVLFNKSGTYTTLAASSIRMTTNASIIYSPPSPLAYYPINSDSTLTPLRFSLSAVAVVTAAVNLPVEFKFTGLGATSSCNIYLGITKIA